jgi:hypothetical protein
MRGFFNPRGPAIGSISLPGFVSPQSVMVFNYEWTESQALAFYFPRESQVPAENLVGVAVPSSEGQDFDRKLAPADRAVVDKLKVQGRNPHGETNIAHRIREIIANITTADLALGPD